MKLQLQPRVLRWARERAGLEPLALAGVLKVDQDRVTEWEKEGELTFALLQKLAKATGTPEGQLFLPEPPVERLPVPDFRTVADQADYKASPELIDTLHDAQLKQDWYREYQLRLGAEPLPYVGSLNLRMRPERAAEVARGHLGLDSSIRTDAENWEAALRLQIATLEDHGILVLRNALAGSGRKRKLRVEEFRGFALSDPYAPLVFINNQDAQSAQMFTLFHEVVHIGLDESGISNPFEAGTTNNRVERFCNQVAAELLVPAAELQRLVGGASSTDAGTIARRFKVSVPVVLIRLRELGHITPAEFRQLYEQENQRFAERRRSRKSNGGDFYAAEFVRVGKPLARAVAESALEGRTSYRDACRLLGVASAKTVNGIAKRLDLIR